VKLEAKVAVVTGGTRGIGRAIAEAFAAEGAQVVVNSRSSHAAVTAASEIGHGAIGLGADLSTEVGVEKLFAAIDERFSSVDVLVNNAGMSMIKKTADLTADDWRRTLDLNLTAPFLCSQRAARRMLASGGGNIVNVASIQAFAAFPRRLAYGVSKAGLVMMTRVMAIEWAPTIRVNAVAPGFISTDLVLNAIAEGKVDIDAVKRRTPQMRLGSPADVAKACVFLACDDAAFVTGQTLVADGGWLAYGFT